MKSYARAHLTDVTLLRNAVANTSTACRATADQVADIGEIDARKLYLPTGYPSMHAFCMHELHLSEHAAFKRIQVARKARRFPAIFHAIADGRLHLTAVLLLAPHLIEDTAEELLAAATHKSKAEVEWLLAQRFPRPDVPTVLEPLAPARPTLEVVATMVPPSAELAPELVDASSIVGSSEGVVAPMAQPTPSPAPRPRLIPLSPERFGFQLTIDQETHDMLRYGQSLLSHAVPPGDLAAVHKRLIAEGIARIEQRRFGAADAAPGGPRGATESRHIPVEVRREVWRRDGGRCTFVSETGVRCTATEWLQFDHVHAYARDGATTAANIRLLCRGHNQYEADQTYGIDFMRGKRQGGERSKEARGKPAQG